MEIRHLRAFVAVADALHFARAAEQLNLAPSTVTEQIGDLEKLLGASLFIRKTRSGVSLTPAGKIFLQEAKLALSQIDRAERIGKRGAASVSGTVVFGHVISAALSGIISEALIEFQKRHPDIEVTLKRLETFKAMQEIIDGQMDVAITRLPLRYPSGISGFLIMSDDFYVALPSSHRLAKRQADVTLRDIADEDFIGTSMEMEMGFWGNLAAVMLSGKAPNVVARASDIISVMAMVGAGRGITALSGPMKNMMVPNVVVRKVCGSDRRAEHAAVYRRDDNAPAVIAFLDILKQLKRTGARP